MATDGELPTIHELDELGNVASTLCFARRGSNDGDSDLKLIRRATPAQSGGRSNWHRLQSLSSVFLPAGYPESVTPDYLPYQTYGILQAFASSLAGLLASRAVLQGVGVGDANATPTAALFLTILQDSFGRVATILFAWRLGTHFEPECKQYRLVADILNDAALISDCLSPAFPFHIRVPMLCASSCSRAVCGIAAGSAKAALRRHFIAKEGSVGDLTAKEGSQETAISLLGMLIGTVLVSYITTPLSTWITLLLLIAVHLFLNYLGVRAVTMHTLNRQRANIVFQALDESDTILSPQEVAARERVFEWDGALRWSGNVLGHCRMGVSWSIFAREFGVYSTTDQVDILKLFQGEKYFLCCDNTQPRGALQIAVCLKEDAGQRDYLRAWVHALLLAKSLQHTQLSCRIEIELSMKKAGRLVDAKNISRLRAAGWDLDESALVTGAISRIRMGSEGKKDR
ncbi:hypothetical protein BOTBODRAFT_124590 [Botryobasidium botryosum FD-172 SS1]|uniref:DUF647-domain-containing protein n=1 Tax=Botryobasidium botryosum (strain FD-172 SS1) TaxID=930990 RepID=A0A067N1E5_BOTB1|nr:hypothetical protein BOTBODRAFT_124590 [Botryobasidium botryosum FD-172 SS1]